MINYNDLYELLRKEKYSEQLQSLPKDFIESVREYFDSQKKLISTGKDLFSDTSLREKKQYENSKSLFNELMLRRKKKILNLVFVAAETGVMKRDLSNMFSFEQELFEHLVKSVEDNDSKVKNLLSGISEKKVFNEKMVVFSEDVDEMVDMQGIVIGPFKKGVLANLEADVADLLVLDNKAKFIDT